MMNFDWFSNVETLTNGIFISPLKVAHVRVWDGYKSCHNARLHIFLFFCDSNKRKSIFSVICYLLKSS